MGGRHRRGAGEGALPPPEHRGRVSQRFAGTAFQTWHRNGEHRTSPGPNRESAKWREKAEAETPAVLPPANAVYALSQAAAWGAAGQKKLMQAVQTTLTQRGHPPGTLDGTWGAPTFYALVAWQKAEKLPATGVLDLPTLTRLSLHTMQEPQAAPVTVVQGPVRAPAGNSRGSGNSGSKAVSPTWEDVAKFKVLQGSPTGGGMRPPLPFR